MTIDPESLYRNSRVDTALAPISLMLLGVGLTRADDIAIAMLGIVTFFRGQHRGCCSVLPETTARQ
jgi:hypothetical protein